MNITEFQSLESSNTFYIERKKGCVRITTSKKIGKSKIALVVKAAEMILKGVK